ncbi:MAG: hypothetical protein AAGN82_27505, partial [Myxococcota bacterium]
MLFSRPWVHAPLMFLMSLTAVVACGIDTSVFGTSGPTSGTGGMGEGGGDGTGGEGGDERPPARAERVDLLLVIDNSRSMADKQEILALAIPSLLRSLTNPRCVDADGVISPTQPLDGLSPCPAGSERTFPPVTDLNVGVVTSSLGGRGSDACSDDAGDDRGRLVRRAPGNTGDVNTYLDLGYLAWDPLAARTPPGERNGSNLETNLRGLLLGAGQLGCGFEATMESWYRFLVDPDPYATVEVENGEALLVGTDDVLLDQRRAFLRPDSLLLIVSLSDENDCSVRDGGVFYLATQIRTPNGDAFRLPRARAACDEDPNDPCCRSCGQAPGPGCDTSEDKCEEGPLTQDEDRVNVRCWQQKRRFGLDFLQPISRYVDGLTEPVVADRNGNLVPNPIFSDLNPADEISNVRDERLVLMTSLVGVPWQNIARRDAAGDPDLLAGRDAAGEPRGAFQSAAELIANDTWDLILGEPSRYFSDEDAFPTDPHMLESTLPRTGQNPLTGDPIAPPGALVGSNAINGTEYTTNGADLQYACIFRLLSPRDCNAV